VGLLVDAERDVQRQIDRRLGWIAERGYDSSPYTLKRLKANLEEIRLVLREAYRTIGKTIRADLQDLASVEASFAHASLTGALESVGLSLGVGIAEGELLRQIVAARPFQGALLRDWVAKLERDAFTRVAGAVRQGMLQGESISEIVRRLRGTRAGRFADGILAIGRREAETVVRTAVAHVANNAREATWDENEDLISGLQWVATLDGRTCEVCMPRDGKLYTMDHRPKGHAIPWGAGPGKMHMRDRCTSAPVLKSWRELGISASEVTGEQRAALDGFVPADTTFAEWIVSQPAAVQNRALGVRRATLLRSGEETFSELFDRRGHLVLLEELEAA
jgi:SPP1 gp7 family putative phage head morphogenesis protein